MIREQKKRRYYEGITHVSSLVVESQGAAGEKGDEGKAGQNHRENKLVVKIVKHNRLKGETWVWVLYLIYVGPIYTLRWMWLFFTLTMMNILVTLMATRRPQTILNPQEERQKQRRGTDICHILAGKV